MSAKIFRLSFKIPQYYKVWIISYELQDKLHEYKDIRSTKLEVNSPYFLQNSNYPDWN